MSDLATSHNRVGDLVFSVADYHRILGRYPNLITPARFTEHLLRLMLSRDGRSALRAEISDKELVKAYVERRLGPGFTPKTIAVLRTADEVLSYRYPSECVIKPTHMSGKVVTRSRGVPEPDRAKIARWLGRNYYDHAREPNYRSLQPKIIVEELLTEPQQTWARDYKVFCFFGEPKFIGVDGDRFVDHRRNLYSPAWRELPFAMDHPRLFAAVPCPARLEEMLDAAARLAAGLSFVRIDFYLLPAAMLVGELTNFPLACRSRFVPDRADVLLGRLFRTPNAEVETLLGELSVA